MSARFMKIKSRRIKGGLSNIRKMLFGATHDAVLKQRELLSATHDSVFDRRDLFNATQRHL